MGQVSTLNPQTITGNADADYSTKQYYLVDVEATTGNTKLCSAAGQRSRGVLMDKPAAADRACLVAMGGIVPCVAGGTVTAGDYITTDANGKGVTATGSYTDTQAGSATDALIGPYIIGIALTGAASGEQFQLQITHAGAVNTTAAA